MQKQNVEKLEYKVIFVKFPYKSKQVYDLHVFHTKIVCILRSFYCNLLLTPGNDVHKKNPVLKKKSNN